MVIISGSQNQLMASEIANYCETTLCDIEISRFADGEVYVEINKNIRGKEIFIIQSTKKFMAIESFQEIMPHLLVDPS